MDGRTSKSARPTFKSWRQQSKFLLRHSCGTICGAKLNYCLGFAACFMVVFVSAVVMSVLSNAPVVFLRLSEAEVGEIDLQLVSAGWTGARLLNYSTVAAESLGPRIGDQFTYHAPRFRFAADVLRLDDCHPAARAAADAAAARGSAHPVQWSYNPGGAPETAGVCTAASLEEIDAGLPPGADGVVRLDPAKTCLQVLCSSEYVPFATAQVYAIDSAREARMGLGRAYSYGSLAPGAALVHKNLATVLGLKPGDDMFLSFDARRSYYTDAFVRGLFDAMVAADEAELAAYTNSTAYNATATSEAELDAAFPLARGEIELPSNFRINLPIAYAGSLESSLGKFASSETTAVLVEYGTLAAELARAMNVNGTALALLRTAIGAADMYEHASEVNVNLPPPRIGPYLSSDFDTIQKNVLQFTAKAVYAVGFNQIDADEPIVESLRASRFFALFLGLITNIILVILTGLAILLIYSLLMVNVETRTFEMGTMRMLGLTKAGVVQLFLLQAFLYALPAYVVGMGVSQLAFWLLARVFEDATDVAISPYLSVPGIILATVLGFTIPVISAMAPIKTALGISLVSALAVNRSKQTAVKITLERSEDGAFSWPLVVTGSLLAGFGFVVYYLLPLALLSFNLTLLLNIFFALLIGMLLGLSLLALNFQHIIERTMVAVFFQWWESTAVATVVVKNLVSHRLRNRKTHVMYSVSLAVIVFISVSFSLQIQTFVFSVRRSQGALMTVNSPPHTRMAELEGILAASPIVREWATSSRALSDIKADLDKSEVSNLGRISRATTEFYAVSPNFFETTLDGFLTVGAARAGYKRQSLSAMLHTPLGASTALLATTLRDSVGLRSVDETWLLIHAFVTASGEAEYYHLLRTMAFVDAGPVFAFSKFPAVEGLDAVVSYPTMRRMLEEIGGDEQQSVAIEDIPIDTVYLSISENVDDGALDNLLFDLRNFDVSDLRSDVEALDGAETVLNFFFIFTTAMSMLIAYFSLTSTVASNIFESSKEIAVLRSIGATKWQIRRIYVYEAFVLVMSSACTGVAVGALVSYTMVVQRILFSQLPVPFVLPWGILIAVFIVATLSAIVAALFPINRLVKRSPVEIMRM